MPEQLRPDAAAAFARLRPAMVAIDGPAASGKSTVGHRVSAAVGFLFFDSGVMYRAVTWAALARGVDVHDPDAAGALAEALDLDILPPEPGCADGRVATVLVDGRDVTWELRQPPVDQNVSAVAAHARVRAAMSQQQRRIGLRYGTGVAEQPGIVMVGRDIGTVVLPEAPLKVFMLASAEQRARRRWAEMTARGAAGAAGDYEQVLADLVARDLWDGSRAVAPMHPAADAVALDTSDMTVGEVVAQVIALGVARSAQFG